MDRSQKEALVASMNEIFDSAGSVVVTHYSGLSVSEITDLRVRMREADAQFKVTKNRLARRALEGTKFEGLTPLFEGPTAIAYSDDPVAPARVAVKFAKDNDMVAMVHSPHRDKKRGILRSLDVAEEVGLPMPKLIIPP